MARQTANWLNVTIFVVCFTSSVRVCTLNITKHMKITVFWCYFWTKLFAIHTWEKCVRESQKCKHNFQSAPQTCANNITIRRFKGDYVFKSNIIVNSFCVTAAACSHQQAQRIIPNITWNRKITQWSFFSRDCCCCHISNQRRFSVVKLCLRMAATGWSLNRGPGQHCGSDQNDERNADGPQMAQMFNNNYRNTLYSTDCVPLNFISIFLFCFYLSVSLVSDYCAIWSSAFCPILNTRHGLAYSIFDFFCSV